jgi:phosphate transport system substrate-binding protein
MFPIVQSAAPTFEKHTGIKIELKGGGSEKGIRSLLAADADICMVSREMLDSDSKEVSFHTIGYDGIALITNKSIPIDEISERQVIDIYCGKIINWVHLTGTDNPISVISKHEGHGTKTMFDAFFSLESRITDKAFLFHSNNESIAMVSSDPNAIGYVSIGSAEHAVALGLGLKILKFNGVAATSENVSLKKYPLCRPLNLVIKKDSSNDIYRFVEFMESLPGQQFVRLNHFVVLTGVNP